MNKTVLITGASRGIGKACAIKFAQNGYNVVINYASNDSAANETLKAVTHYGVRALTCKADISNPEEVKSMFDKIVNVFGGIDVLVNNAGISKTSLLIDQDYEDIKKIMDINLNGAIYCSKEALKIMASQMQGKIVNVSSMWGERGGSMESVYSASKAGMIGLTKALAKEYGNMHINVNAVCPGAIDTDMSKVLSDETRNMLIQATPFGRLGTPDDIANLVYFLSSEESDFITGQVITIDGGIEI